MKIISWNCQGLAQSKAIRALKHLLKDAKPDLIFLCEIKTAFSSSLSKALLSHCLASNHFVPPTGTAGGLLLAWNNNIRVKILSSSQSQIHAEVSHDLNSSPAWLFSGVYCPCYPIGKTQFWIDINSFADNLITTTTPWLLMGDFNSIISQAEKSGGKSFASSSKKTLYNDLNNLHLIDLGFHGHPFTWSNKRNGLANIQQRLDRGVANSDWCTLFPKASIFHLPAIGSDHSPLILNSNTNANGGPKPFKFEAMWLDDDSCHDIVDHGWH